MRCPDIPHVCASVERLEDALILLWLNANAIITHGKTPEILLFLGGEVDLGLLPNFVKFNCITD